MTRHAYRYVGADGRPLQRCPGCGHALNLNGEPPGVVVLTRVGAIRDELPDYLDDDGDLADVAGAVAAGYHVTTACGGCRYPLDAMDDVTEIQTTVDDDPARRSWLQVAFYDASDVPVASFTGPLATMLERIGEFVTLHGVDPAKNGRGAAAGTIRFRPISAP